MWEDHWCMSFNASKCSSISITRKTNKIVHNYTLHNQVLDRVSCATYLGVELSSNLTWAAHIDKTTAKGNRQVGFLKRNLPINCAKGKETAYKGLVGPIMEYCAPVWDTPHVDKYKHQLEMVQRRAARFTLGRYHYDSHVSDMLAQLQWETLEHRCWKSRLTLFYKIQLGLVAIPLPEFIVRPERPRPGHPHQFQRIYCRTDAYKYSFFPFAIKQWNAPPHIRSLSEHPISFPG